MQVDRIVQPDLPFADAETRPATVYVDVSTVLTGGRFRHDTKLHWRRHNSSRQCTNKQLQREAVAAQSKAG